MNLERYHRQMLLPGFGETAQRRLRESTALVVGCGALGTVSANLLARAGVGHLILADRDFIELSNLQRQVLFEEADVENAVPKAEAARRRLAAINSEVRVTAVVDDVNHANVEALLAAGSGGEVDVIVDGVDNFETRLVLNDAAVKHGVPYIYAGAVATVGMCYAVLSHTRDGDSPWERAGVATPCLRCIFEQAPPPGMNPTCDTAGALGPAVSLIASYQAAETLKVLTGNYAAVNDRLLSVDVWENRIRHLAVHRAYEIGNCRCCKQRAFEFLHGHFASRTTTLCGRNAVQLLHARTVGRTLDFDELAARLALHGKVRASPFMLRAELREGETEYELTLFTDGRAIVKGTQEPAVARSLYAKYVGA